MTPERSRQLDAMSEQDKQADILARLERSGSMRIDTRQAMAFWGAAMNVLEDAGKIDVEFVDLREQQCSFYRLRLRRKEMDT